MSRSDNVKASIIMLIAVGAFSMMDAGIKVLSAHYPPLQVAALRGLSSVPVIVVWIAFTGGFRQLLRVRFGLHVIRAVLGIIMLSAFAYGVRHIPLSEAYSIFFVAPLLITAFAVPILGERVEWQRWVAIGAGLVGVLIVLRPTGASLVTLPGIAVLICATGYALSAITVRILGRTDSTQSMVFWLMTMVGAGAGILAIPQWKAIQPQDWIVIAGIALTGSLGQWAVTEAFRSGEASFIAPFEYTALAWGLALDWIFWRSVPGGGTFAGAALIIASGLYLIRRERVHVEAEHP
ncbi:MAG TPA: DMT family transporter [Thermoanaerobaculia bacterium]|nr:DMT family transporter [Thermoanaerobaculia bacterium]